MNDTNETNEHEEIDVVLPEEGSAEDDETGAQDEDEGVDPKLEDPEPDQVELTITEALCDPVALYVHGVGRYELRIGQPKTVPIAALDALRDANVTFKIKDV